ncbi:C-C motif chemokine 27b [Erpetoichthys calabaricus]|uniref:C-C motif chemokine 27b n=1 Tax=Erpetoichthys calabaricus TaxID=27687 RepID=UPI00109FFD33|nr:C-C motif chemokine 27b [Erpetoichthys calabaricus]
MDFRLLLVLASCGLIVAKTKVSAQRKCCTQVAVKIQREMLNRVKCYEVLKNNGVCDLNAIMLHIKNKKYCVDPENKKVRKWLKQIEKEIPKPNSKKKRKRRKVRKC